MKDFNAAPPRPIVLYSLLRRTASAGYDAIRRFHRQKHLSLFYDKVSHNTKLHYYLAKHILRSPGYDVIRFHRLYHLSPSE